MLSSLAGRWLGLILLAFNLCYTRKWPSLPVAASLWLPLAYPSRFHLSPNRQVSIKHAEWGRGNMLPIQHYRAVCPNTTSYGRVAQLDEQMPVEDSALQEYFQAIPENPRAYNLSKSASISLDKYETLSPRQRQLLRLKIEKELMASQPIPNTALEILYCDNHICVTNKPSGVLSAPGPRQNPSLAHLVRDILHPNVDLDQMVVHRLDMDTSGILVFALTLEASSQLHSDFRQRCIQKTYEALVRGCFDTEAIKGEIDAELERDPDNLPFMRVARPKQDSNLENQTTNSNFNSATNKLLNESPKPCLTTWALKSREIYCGHPASRLELGLCTGRTHQLRVHCAEVLGTPIFGDAIYGGIRKCDGFQSRLCLHAGKLCMYHPISRAPMIFEADTPF